MSQSHLEVSLIRTDGGTQLRTVLNPEVVDEYADAMKSGVVFPPVNVFYDGESYWLSDGYHRLEAAKSIGSPTIAADIRQGTRREAVLHAVGANANHGLRRSHADKRRAVMTLLTDTEWNQWSNSEIARRSGVHHQLVASLRRKLNPLDDSSSQIRQSADGRTINTANIGRSRKRASSPKEPVPTATAPEPQAIEVNFTPPLKVTPTEPQSDQQTIDVVAELAESDLTSAEPASSESNGLEAKDSPQVSPKIALFMSSESASHYTSLHIIDAALSCLGEIDLDPCSNSQYHLNVPAKGYFTKEDDALAQPWVGRVFMNPPYGNKTGDWVEKLCAEFESGHVTQALILVASCTETEWFHRLRQYPRCFIRGRLKFISQKNHYPVTFGSVAFYLGRTSQGLNRFVEAFKGLGDIFALVEETREANSGCRNYTNVELANRLGG